VIFRWPLQGIVGPWFAMKTIPFNRLSKSKFARKQLEKIHGLNQKGQPYERLALGSFESV
jgi:hypothetical protein